MTHPYSTLPDKNFWRKAIANQSWRDVNFFERSKFAIERSDRLATAGSCFAQNISRYLRASGRELLTTEPAHPLLSRELAEQMNYQQFTARYGNIYTVRQLLELFDQAVGDRDIIEDLAIENNIVYDLMRPAVQPQGFSSIEEARADRAFHISCVRRMFETAEVLVFTLGLTEAWRNAEKNFVYPSCPGTVRGTFNATVHQFVNYSYGEILADFTRFVEKVKTINRDLKIILTVSPVALAATYEDKNVLLASSYSKSVLRAICGEMEKAHGFVEYFPAYEIISSACSFGQYLDSDLRGVNERGVGHVMSCFFKVFFADRQAPLTKTIPQTDSNSAYLQLAEKILNVECEEIFNDPAYSMSSRKT